MARESSGKTKTKIETKIETETKTKTDDRRDRDRDRDKDKEKEQTSSPSPICSHLPALGRVAAAAVSVYHRGTREAPGDAAAVREPLGDLRNALEVDVGGRLGAPGFGVCRVCVCLCVCVCVCV